VRQILAISRRETRAFFRSAMAPVLLTGFLVMTGLFFTLFAYAYSEMSRTALNTGRGGDFLNLTEGIFQPLVVDVTILLLLLLPAVTMRLLSAEYRSGRYDLIMSYPVPDHGWVLGKWLSAMTVVAVMILATGAYFGVVAVLGKAEVGPVLAALLGLVLLAATITSWGIFFSALFVYQVVAYILTLGFVLLLYVVGGLEPHFPGAVGNAVTELSLQNHFERFSRGVIDSRDVTYFVGLTVLGLYLATAALGSRRQSASRRLWRWLAAAALVVVVLALHSLSMRWPLRVDLTPDRRYSLAPQTVQILDALASERDLAGAQVPAAERIDIYAFYERIDPARKGVEVLLRAATDRNRRLHYRVVDPQTDLELVERYGVTLSRSVVVAIGDQHTLLLQPSESALINAVYRLATRTRPVVYHLQGHGEHLLKSDERPGYSGFAAALREQGYDVRPLALTDFSAVPTDGRVLVIAGPRFDLEPTELAAIDTFLAAGGALMALCDPGTPPTLTAWLRRFNVRLGDDVIVAADRAQREHGVGARTLVVVDGYGTHEITRGLTGVATLFPLVQSMSRVTERLPGITGSILLFSSPLSWSEQDPDTRFGGRARFDRGVDYPGPLPFGVALAVVRAGVDDSAAAAVPRRPASGTLQSADDPVMRYHRALQTQPDAPQAASVFATSETSRLVVLGNSEFATNANLGRYGNRDLLLNILGWLSQEEVLINLRGRDLVSEPVVLTVLQKEILGWSCILGWPLLVGSVSLAILLRHRRRRG